jgi:hypothetical protein
MTEHAGRGRPRFLPLDAVAVNAKFDPQEVSFIDRCGEYRDKSRASSVRDIVKASRLSYTPLAQLIQLGRETEHILQEAGMEAIRLASTEPFGSAYHPSGSSPVLKTDEPFLMALASGETFKVLKTLTRILPTLESIFKQMVVDVDKSDEADGYDLELSDVAGDKAKQNAFTKALGEALEAPFEASNGA